MINKSLDEIDVLADSLDTSTAEENDKVSKANDDEDLSGNEVSDDTPEDNEEGDNEDTEDNDAEEQSPEEGDNEDEDTDSDSEAEEDSDEQEDDEYEKSLQDELSSNESVKKALEVSEFLQEFVKSFDTTIANQRETLSKSIKESADGSNMLLAKSIQGMVKSQKAIAQSQAQLMKSLGNLNSRLDKIERQPVTRKSVSSNNTKPVNKSFEASAGNKPAKPTNQLSKAQASAMLTNAFEQGNTAIRDDLLAFDSLGDFNALSDNAKNILGIK